jgi:3-oxoacyl-[acyl-carrier protein] reductase
MRTALITGGSRGIGAACARKLAQQGCRVAVNYRQSRAQAEELASQIGGIAVQGDVSDPVQAQEMVDTVLENFCQLDILVCNAGVSHVGLLSDMTDAQWRRVFGVNVDGVFHCCRAAIPHFVHRKQGRIVTLSSMWGQVGASCEAAYAASKGAVIALTKSLAKELGPSGIQVNCVAPGVIDTDMNRSLTPQDLAALREETPLGRIGTADQVAEAVWFLCSEQSAFLTGQVIGVNGGLVI